MFDHIGLKVRNFEASVRFYRDALAPLGSQLDSSGEGYAGFGPKGQPALWLYAYDRPVAAGTHVAFRAANRAAVDRFHAAGPACGLTTARATTPRSCWTRTATTSRRCV
jgi:catechol 2,3-dioxygenase-like lactoylglutathione lyase family enzyme